MAWIRTKNDCLNGHIIVNKDGNQLPQRDNLQVEGLNLTDDNINNITKISPIGLNNDDLDDIINSADIPGNSIINNGLIYSTSEKIVGTWIDGKPLYQKTVLCKTASSITDLQQSMNATPHNVSNVAYVVDTHLHYNDEMVIWDTTRYFLAANTTSTDIVLRTNRSAMANREFYVTIQYTKTTD